MRNTEIDTFKSITLKNEFKNKLPLKFRLSVIFFMTLAWLLFGAYMSSVNEMFGSILVLGWFIGLGIYFIKKIKTKLIKPNLETTEEKLKGFMLLNNFYELDSRGNLLTQMQLGYDEDEETMVVVAGKDGTIYHDKAIDLGHKLEAVLGYPLQTVDEKPTAIAYVFKKKEAKRKIVHDMHLEPPSNDLKIHLYDDIAIDLKKNYSTLLSGASGAGKSYLAYYIIASFLQKYTVLNGKKMQSEIWVIDPKESDLFKHMVFSGMPENRYGSTVSDAFKIVNEVTEILNERKAIYSKSKSFNVVMADLGYPPVLLVIDEFSSLMATMDKKQASDFLDKLGNVMRLGRGLSIGVLLISQSPNASTFGGSGLRAQMVNSLYLGYPDQQASLMMFNKSQKDLPVVNEIGEGLASIDDKEPQKFKAPTFKGNIDESLQPLFKYAANIYDTKTIDYSDFL